MSENALQIEWIDSGSIDANPAYINRQQKQKRALADVKKIANRLKGLLPARWQKAEPVIEDSEEEEFIPPRRVHFSVSVRVDTIDFDSITPFELDPAVFTIEGGEHLKDTAYVSGVIYYHSGGQNVSEELIFPISNLNPTRHNVPYENIQALRPV